MVGSEVFSGYEGTIYTSTQITKEINETITGTSTITIDNTDNIKRLPKITISPSTTTNIIFNSISDGDNIVSCSGISLTSTSDTLVLDFKNQVYTKNGENIIDSLTFDNKRISIQADGSQDINIDGTNEMSVSISYQGYTSEEAVGYVESFSLDYSVNTSHSRGYKDNKVITTTIEGNDYNVNISKFNSTKKFLQDILDGRKFRIRFLEEHSTTSVSKENILIDVIFDTYNYGFSSPDEIMLKNMGGQAKDLITH